jgi:hypothetical protein
MTGNGPEKETEPKNPEIGSRLDGPPLGGVGQEIDPSAVPWPEERPTRRFNPWLAFGLLVILYIVAWGFYALAVPWLLAPLMGGVALVLLVVEILYGARHDGATPASVVYSLIIGVMLAAVSMLIIAMAQGLIEL